MPVVFLGDKPYVDLALDLLGQRPDAPPLYTVAGTRREPETGHAASTTVEAIIARLKQSLGGADPKWGRPQQHGLVRILLALGRRDEAEAVILSTGEPAGTRAAESLAELWVSLGDSNRAMKYIEAAVGPLAHADPSNSTSLWEPSILIELAGSMHHRGESPGWRCRQADHARTKGERRGDRNNSLAMRPRISGTLGRPRRMAVTRRAADSFCSVYRTRRGEARPAIWPETRLPPDTTSYGGASRARIWLHSDPGQAPPWRAGNTLRSSSAGQRRQPVPVRVKTR
jgi:hypothetical protein